ncbi:hypothetical protein Ciccas_013380, partial [Cichlidogyrus casuarinus]
DLTKKVLIDTKAGDYLSCVPMDRLAYIHAIAKKELNPLVIEIFENYPTAFKSDSDVGASFIKDMRHCITTKVNHLTVRFRRLGPGKAEKVKAKLDQMLKQGIIAHATPSQFLSPIHVVDKPNGEVEFSHGARKIPRTTY